TTQRGSELQRIGGAIERHTEEARTGKSRGGSPKLRADLRITAGTSRKTGLFAVGHETRVPPVPPIFAIKWRLSMDRRVRRVGASSWTTAYRRHGRAKGAKRRLRA